MQNATHLICRRNLLTGIVAAPALAIAAAPTAVRAEDIDAAAARAKAELKDAKGTKLILLGTGSGPNSRSSAPYGIKFDGSQRRSLRARLRYRSD